MVAAGKFESIGTNVANIPVDIVDDIECVGDEGNYL
jgi:hypothetical protein